VASPAATPPTPEEPSTLAGRDERNHLHSRYLAAFTVDPNATVYKTSTEYIDGSLGII